MSHLVAPRNPLRHTQEPRKRVLQVSFACDPISSMESRLGWHRAVAAAERYDTWVICDQENQPAIDDFLRHHGAVPGLTIDYVPSTATQKRVYDTPGISYRAYHDWHQRVFQRASELHTTLGFDLAHQVGLCGYREPGYLWKLGIPFIWGPIGGTQNFPWRYLNLLAIQDAAFEVARTVANYYHLHYRYRVRAASQVASKIYAANSTAQRDFGHALQASLELQLETGLQELPDLTPRTKSSNEPLRILWAGRFRPWKGLPLLLHALRDLPDRQPLEVRLIGHTKDERPYRRLATKLGLDTHLEWLGWPAYHETFEHYAWADTFVFTSLRDTSGTGLLEALAHGCPIIGMDHQGAHDIMTPECAIPIPLSSPQQSIQDIRAAIIHLANDPDLRQALSRGARQRAQQFLWSKLSADMVDAYESVMIDQASASTPQQKHRYETTPASSALSLASATPSPHASSSVPSEHHESNSSEHRPPSSAADSSIQRKVQHGILALVDQAFVSLNTFVTMIFVAQLCLQSEFNRYALAWSVFAIFRVIQERALAAPYVVFAHERDRDGPTFLGSSLVHQCCFSLLSSILLALLAVGVAIDGRMEGMASCLFWFAIATPFLLLRDHLRAVSCTHFRYGVAASLSASAFLLQTGMILAAYGVQVLRVEIVIAAMGLASLLPCLVWLLARPHPYRVYWTQVTRDWLTVSRYSRWLVAARCFPSAASGLLPWIVLWQINENASGILVGCLTFANLSMMFILGANNFFQPRAVQALHSEGKRALCRILLESIVVFAVVLSSLCGFYFLFGEWLLEWIYGEGFTGYGNVVSLLGVNVLIVGFSMVAGNGMAALGKPKGLFWGEVAYAIVTLLMALLLTAPYGLIGTAIALCCGSLAATFVSLFVLGNLLVNVPSTPIRTTSSVV